MAQRLEGETLVWPWLLPEEPRPPDQWLLPLFCQVQVRLRVKGWQSLCLLRLVRNGRRAKEQGARWQVWGHGGRQSVDTFLANACRAWPSVHCTTPPRPPSSTRKVRAVRWPSLITPSSHPPPPP